MLTIEEFEVTSQKWRDVTVVTASEEKVKFGSGRFCDGHHATLTNSAFAEEYGN